MSRDRADDDLVHFRFDKWGITDISTTCRGILIMLFLRVMIKSGWVDISIMGMLGQDELDLHIFSAIRPQEKGI